MKNKKTYLLTLRSKSNFSLPKGFYNPFFLNGSIKYLICLQHKKKILEVIGIIHESKFIYSDFIKKVLLINYFNKKLLSDWCSRNKQKSVYISKNLSFLLNNNLLSSIETKIKL